MKAKKVLLRIAGAIFGIVALLHLVRVILKTELNIGGWDVPMVISMAGFILAAVLAIWLWMLSSRKEE